MKRNQKGFTLMEMLIVVAIIAILIAVSIPIFTAQLEKAREATDDANLRAAKAVATAQFLIGEYVIGNETYDEEDTLPTTIYYDAAEGVLTETKPTGYGKGTKDGTNEEDHTGQVIKVTFDGTSAKAEWTVAPTPNP